MGDKPAERTLDIIEWMVARWVLQFEQPYTRLPARYSRKLMPMAAIVQSTSTMRKYNSTEIRDTSHTAADSRRGIKKAIIREMLRLRLYISHDGLRWLNAHHRSLCCPNALVNGHLATGGVRLKQLPSGSGLITRRRSRVPVQHRRVRLIGVRVFRC